MDIHTLFIHLAIEGHLSCFQLGAIVNKAAINIHVRSPCRHTFLFLLGTFLGVVLVIIQAAMLIRLQKKLLGMFIFYEQAVSLYIPTNIGRTDAEAETPTLWPPHAKSWLIGKDWCWEGLRAGGEGDNRGWDGWMASPTRWTWVWVNSGSWWWTGRPGVLWFMGLQRVGHDWVTELNWTEQCIKIPIAPHPCPHFMLSIFFAILMERNGNPLQYSCLENSMDRGVW